MSTRRISESLGWIRFTISSSEIEDDPIAAEENDDGAAATSSCGEAENTEAKWRRFSSSQSTRDLKELAQARMWRRSTPADSRISHHPLERKERPRAEEGPPYPYPDAYQRGVPSVVASNLFLGISKRLPF
uniref:Uncharacterized protein n=1 Tax=Ananas comosus var. bracteatus TaxID=296719 RepID=A0A6V7NJA9_ANACO|nr:unnamed protein product [Ananas comosus var. bracteatus]